MDACGKPRPTEPEKPAGECHAANDGRRKTPFGDRNSIVRVKFPDIPGLEQDDQTPPKNSPTIIPK